jgi:hypothetical protein
MTLLRPVRTALSLALSTSMFASLALAQQSDSAQVVDASAALLRAISTQDTALARRVLLPGMQFAAIPSPAQPTSRARWQADSTFYRSLPQRSETLLERMWSPQVALHGSVATVAAPYDFYINGTFSHCGTDVFLLVKHQGEWRISAVQYTVQRQQCVPSPLGPPR